MTPITAAELAKIKARADAATTGPWVHKPIVDAEGQPYPTLFETWQFIEPSVCGLWKGQEDTADFIAHSREDIPRLVAEVERLREMLASLTEALDYWIDSAEGQHWEAQTLRQARAYLAAVSASTVR